jgi:predicted GIY-YIG superfamily endonuclease
MKKWTVYLHITPNGKKYVGITGQKPSRRWQNGYGYASQYFKRAIKLYGWDNIQHIIVAENLTEKQAGEMEIKLIADYKSDQREYGYNIKSGGKDCSPFHGKTQEELNEIWRKISESNKGKGQYFGKTDDEILTIRNKMIEARKRWKFSKESIEKMRENQPNARRVILLNTGEIFLNTHEAERKYGTCQTNICKCCRNKLRSSGKHPITGEKLVWRYYDDYLGNEKEAI